jgi:BirA family biotin operon repressor/biotin-[acetyl-CoA-carboxylase] ligase
MNEVSFVKKTIEFSRNIDINLFKNFFIFNEISSTNNKAKELAKKGEREGTVVISRIQKRGRGRFDRLWESPEGGIYLSIILKPDCLIDKTTLLPLIAALAVSKTIDYYGLHSKIKWPNDVMVNGKKIAGILLESIIKEEKLEYVILGIGINFNIDINFLSEDIRNNVTSMFYELKISLDYYNFLKKLFMFVDRYYTLFLKGNFNAILREWKENSDTIGKGIRIYTGSEEIIGRVYDIDQSGFLIVKTISGERKIITSGDCFYLDEA